MVPGQAGDLLPLPSRAPEHGVPAYGDTLSLSHRPVRLRVCLRYHYRLDPTPVQRRALARTFGCARVVYNDGLKMRQDAYKAGLPLIGDAELSRRVVTLAKQTPERAWLGEVSAVILQQSLADLGRAYRNWFADLKRVKAARAKGENSTPRSGSISA
jgi:putative transposase